MPNRYVREDAITSEAVNAISWQAEVFWRRLINLVDDFGRYTANLELLRASAFPLRLNRVSGADIGKLLSECEGAGLVSTWTGDDGKSYLAMHKWEVGRAAKSKYPNPPDNICERLKTFAYNGSQVRTLAPDSDNDSDTDNDIFERLPEVLSTDAFKKAWMEYLEYRKANRFKKLQRQSVWKIWIEMVDWEEAGAIQAINETIKNGWQGIFKPKKQHGHSTGSQSRVGSAHDPTGSVASQY